MKEFVFLMQMLHMIKNKETILKMETQESKNNLPGSTAKALITLTNLRFDTITVTTKTSLTLFYFAFLFHLLIEKFLP